MIRCEACGGWPNRSQAEHDLLVLIVEHLRLDHGMSRRTTARKVGEREQFVKRHVDEAPQR